MRWGRPRHPTRAGHAFSTRNGLAPNISGFHNTMSASFPGSSDPTSCAMP